jgi:ferredoxin-NADP reductase
MATFECTLHTLDRCGDDVVLGRISRPGGYTYAAGQWFRLTLVTAEGPQTRTFSLASAPYEAELAFATRLSTSAFKLALGSLELPAQVTISSPGGRLRLPEGADRVVFVVGGVGVSPARSLLMDTAEHGRHFADAPVLFGTRDATCQPFLAELGSLRPIGVRVIPVLEQPPKGWSGETGFITADLIRRHVDDFDVPVYLVCGPPVMVDAIAQVLDSLRIDASRRIVERFGPGVES